MSPSSTRVPWMTTHMIRAILIQCSSRAGAANIEVIGAWKPLIIRYSWIRRGIFTLRIGHNKMSRPALPLRPPPKSKTMSAKEGWTIWIWHSLKMSPLIPTILKCNNKLIWQRTRLLRFWGRRKLEYSSPKKTKSRPSSSQIATFSRVLPGSEPRKPRIKP